MLPRLIATDLDGTLLDHEKQITPRTVAAVRAVVAAGIEFVLVTARPPRTVAHLAERLGGRIAALCGNGTILAEFDAGEQTGLEVYFETAFRVGAVGDDRRVLTDNLTGIAPQMPTIIKVLARSPERAADDMVALADDVLTVAAEVSHSGGRGLLEIAPPRASKASALAWLCEQRGVAASEVAAFGDMPNDLPMLRWAGLGYAMANAHDEVLAAADHVVGHHAQDGVALALEALLSRVSKSSA